MSVWLVLCRALSKMYGFRRMLISFAISNIKRKYLISWTKNPWCYKQNWYTYFIAYMCLSSSSSIIEPVFIFFSISIYLICKYLGLHTQGTSKILFLLLSVFRENSIKYYSMCRFLYPIASLSIIQDETWVLLRYLDWIFCVFAIKDNENRSYL